VGVSRIRLHGPYHRGPANPGLRCRRRCRSLGRLATRVSTGAASGTHADTPVPPSSVSGSAYAS